MEWQDLEFDIIIQGGQSNAEGMGMGPVSDRYALAPFKNVYYLEAEKQTEHLPDCVRVTYSDKPFQICPAVERGSAENPVGDFSLAFAQMYENERLTSDRKLLIIRAAVGGTGFVKGAWGLKDQLYLKLLEMTDYALLLNKKNRIVGFLWHQGECDAYEKNAPDVFRKQLASMLRDVRMRYGAEIPFIAGDFVREWKEKYLADCVPIVEQIRQVVKEAGSAAFVETSDLLSNNQKTGNGDDIHFCREALYILGRRYYQAFAEL